MILQHVIPASCFLFHVRNQNHVFYLNLKFGMKWTPLDKKPTNSLWSAAPWGPCWEIISRWMFTLNLINGNLNEKLLFWTLRLRPLRYVSLSDVSPESWVKNVALCWSVFHSLSAGEAVRVFGALRAWMKPLLWFILAPNVAEQTVILWAGTLRRRTSHVLSHVFF